MMISKIFELKDSSKMKQKVSIFKTGQELEF